MYDARGGEATPESPTRRAHWEVTVPLTLNKAIVRPSVATNPLSEPSWSRDVS